jgi:predicted amidohydrolase YtcJ
MERGRDLQPAVTMMLGLDGFYEYRQLGYPLHCERKGVRTGGVKIIVHEITGDLEPSRERLNEMVLEIHKSGFQAVLHAVEENTVKAACDAIEHALRQFPRPGPRHRIEHCSVCPPALAKRIGELEIMVVTQPSFVYFSGDRYLETVCRIR